MTSAEPQTLRRTRTIVASTCAALLMVSHIVWAQTTIVRPIEIDDVLVNPGIGIETFQRFGTIRERGSPLVRSRS